MSIRTVMVVVECAQDETHCDGPSHVGNTRMECKAITVRGGYGSDFDGDTYHFCTLSCLGDWMRLRQ